MTQQFPPYEQMVKDLFKKLPTIGEEAHHATTGIAGEVGELSEACSRENILEELGDIEFYLEALFQVPGVVPRAYTVFELPHVSLGEVITYLHRVSSRLLDLSKKTWVYGKPLPLTELAVEGVFLRHGLSQLYGYLGTTKEEVRYLNQIKLMMRYPNGYTNEAAIERADKS